MKRFAIAVTGFLALYPSKAQAADNGNDVAALPIRRSGFAMGLQLGAGLANVSGYPNDVRKIGFESYYTESSVAFAQSMSIWFGGALTDWFTFGIGFNNAALNSDPVAYSEGGILFHLEGYPLFSLGRKWTDLGAMFEAGTGAASAKRSDDESVTLIDGGAVSHLGFGVFYEGFRLWRFSIGPYASLDYTWSSSVRSGGGFLGIRTALHAGKVSSK